MKKKNVRKAVNLSGARHPWPHIACSLIICSAFFLLSELQRYFSAAEEAAREIMLEEAISNNHLSLGVFGAQSDKDGVFQLTTLGSLPLKSPKRLIALQLANNNPAFK